MRFLSLLIALLAFLPLTLPAQEKSGELKAPKKDELAEFSKLIHSAVVKQLPKQIEENSGWGQMVEIPNNLPLMGLRKVVKVKDHLEAPHGTWRRFKGKVEEPHKNLKIAVKDFKQLKPAIFRTVTDVDVTLMLEVEVEQWQKGLSLIGVKVIGDANFTSTLVVDVTADVDFTRKPILKLEPKVTELTLHLADFKVRGGPILGEPLRKEVLNAMRGLVKSAEPTVKDYANKSVVHALDESKGGISAIAIMKAMPTPK